MNTKYAYLSDADFLKDFDQVQLKEQFVKITILTFDETPVKDIQGQVSTGSVSIDGNSSVRRTANLTFLAADEENDLTDINNLLSLNKKVKMEIGFTNTTGQYTQYPILWFPLGIYVIINASLSNSSSGITISLQLKDKMCLLNGECGGIIPAATTFNEYDTLDENGEWVTLQPTIYQIIQEVVNHFGGEQLGKIIISGVDSRIKKVVKWTGATPLFVAQNEDGSLVKYTIRSEEIVNNSKYTNIIQFGTGEDIGYINTDFIYPSELAVDAGAAVTEVLDKIKETLGNYEYFYDLDGNFVFQEIQNFLNTTQASAIMSQLQESSTPYVIDISKGKTTYKFSNDNIITSYSNTPQYNMIKNDFIVWGKRKNSDGKEFPIRYHLSIDEKPTEGDIYFVLLYEDESDGLLKVIVPSHYTNKNKIPKSTDEGVFYSYIEDEEIKVCGKWDEDSQTYESINEDKYTCCLLQANDWRTELYLQGIMADPYGIDSNYYYTELKNEWTKMYNLQKHSLILEYNEDNLSEECVTIINKYGAVGERFFKKYPLYIGGFKDETLSKPTTLDFFLDFIDSGANVSKISISNIGRRTKVLNDEKINCLFESDIPDFILIKKSQTDTAALRQECLQKGQQYAQVDGPIYDAITQGGYLNSAYVAIQDLLYQHTGYNETINISCLPIYYLEPNTRIYVEDKRTGIKGDYVISSFNLPLDTSGTMSISASRAMEKV